MSPPIIESRSLFEVAVGATSDSGVEIHMNDLPMGRTTMQDGNFFDMNQLNDFLINYGFQKNEDFFSIYDNDIEKFRLANALKPGTLNVDTQTQALLLATDLAAQENATDNVEDLLRFATKFCEKIHANICDSERQPLSAESIKDLKMRASHYLLNDEESS